MVRHRGWLIALIVLVAAVTPRRATGSVQEEDEGGTQQKIEKVARNTEYLLTGKVVFASAKDMPRDRLVVIANVRYGDVRRTVETREARRTADEIFFTTVWVDIIKMVGDAEPGKVAVMEVIPKLMPGTAATVVGVEVVSRPAR